MRKMVSCRRKNDFFADKAKGFHSRNLSEEFNCLKIEKDFNFLNLNFCYPNRGEGLKIDSDRFISYGFGMRAKGRPSDAIKSIFNEGAKGVIDCERAVLIVKYSELLRDIGDDKFDALFSDSSPLKITSSLPFYYPPRNSPSFTVKELDSEEGLKLGDWVYIENDKDFVSKEDEFLLMGEHGIVVELKKFRKTSDINDIVIMGFTSREEIQKMTIREWNENIFNGTLKGFYEKDYKVIVRRFDQNIFKK